jgi:predicted nucleic acid-binding protein
MIHLLDVNALFALGVPQHEFHRRTESWVERTAKTGASFATCAITELGFLRIPLQTSYGAFTLAQGQKHLKLLKSSSRYRFQFIPDDQDAQQLPGWVTWEKQLTDGHLISLAKAHGATLATLDEGIKDAFLIRG